MFPHTNISYRDGYTMVTGTGKDTNVRNWSLQRLHDIITFPSNEGIFDFNFFNAHEIVFFLSNNYARLYLFTIFVTK